MAFRVGSRYVAHEVVGAGASGTVWRGAGPDGPVAIKVLRPELAADQQVVARFLRERSVLARVRHPHLVGVHDLVAEGQMLALILDLVDGSSLRSQLDRVGTLCPAQAVETVAAVAEALAAVHAAGVVHRDVKPENVLLTASPAGPRPILTDLGVALLTHSPRLTGHGTPVGTAEYLAPEIVTGCSPSPAADVYAAGVLLYELVCGRTPFGAAHPAAIMHRHVHDQPTPVPGMPAALWDLIGRCLAKQPADRPNAKELANQLRTQVAQLRDDSVIEASAEPGAGRPTHLARRSGPISADSVSATVRGQATHEPDVGQGGSLSGPLPMVTSARALLEPDLAQEGRPTHLGRDPADRPLSGPPTSLPPNQRRRWPYAAVAVAVLAVGIALTFPIVARGLPDGGGLVYRAATGWLCPPWRTAREQPEPISLRPCVLARDGSVKAYAETRSVRGRVDVQLHLVRTGARGSARGTVVASGRCSLGAPGETLACGVLEHALDGGRYYAVLAGASGTLITTPVVSG